MLNLFKNISFIREARIFHLKFWQTPSFLFVLAGLFTIGMTLVSFIVARKSADEIFLIVFISSATLVSFLIAVLLARIIGKIIIINQAKNEFLSLVTHQLRSPLTGTKYILEAVLSGNAGALSPQQQDLLKEGSSSNERMLILVNDLLAMAKMAEGDVPYDIKTVNISDLIKNVVTEIKPQAEGRKIKLIYTPGAASLPAKIDEKKIRFVLQNLIDNAVKYTPDGGQVTVNLKKDAKLLTVSVTDTGIGIPADELPKLFGKFYRASNAEKVKKIGTGLGLYIAKNIIERHNGEIWIESKENEGSTFSFKLPT